MKTRNILFLAVLASTVLSSTLTAIMGGLFSDCPKQERVVCKGGIKTVFSKAFAMCGVFGEIGIPVCTGAPGIEPPSSSTDIFGYATTPANMALKANADWESAFKAKDPWSQCLVIPVDVETTQP